MKKDGGAEYYWLQCNYSLEDILVKSLEYVYSYGFNLELYQEH